MTMRANARPVPVALCLGGVDPSSGAGLVRDVLALAAQGVYPMVVPTAETLQNGLTCLQIAQPGMSPRLRLEALAPHLTGRWGVKLGLADLDAEELEALMDEIKALKPEVAIWDPVMAPTSGVGLHSAQSLAGMAGRILSRGEWVVSPNRAEAATLAGLDSDADPVYLAAPWLRLGAKAVWLKGGHSGSDHVEDWWITEAGPTSLGAVPRLPGERRGTGCTLASCWLGMRLNGMDEIPAAKAAAEWLRSQWDEAFTPGGAGRPVLGC